MKTKILILVLATLSAYSNQKYILDCNAILLKTSLDSALSQVGITENTNNNDGYVQKYLDLFKLNRASYCAAGQYWAFYVSAKSLKICINMLPISKTAVSADMFNNGKRKGKQVHYKPEQHDLIFWKKRHSYHGHVERIYRVQKAGWVMTIGFNSSKRFENGIIKEGVFLQRRNIFHPIGRKKILGIIGFRKV